MAICHQELLPFIHENMTSFMFYDVQSLDQVALVRTISKLWCCGVVCSV